MANKVVFITSGTTFRIPSDFGSLVSVEAIGAGGGGANILAGTSGSQKGGAGGGAYAKSNSITSLSPAQITYFSVGAAGATGTNGTSGGDSWFNFTTNNAPASSTEGILAKGGSGVTTSTGATGGQASGSVGNLVYSGGNGGSGAYGLYLGIYQTAISGGGGGAAGPGGNGGNGGAAIVANASGGGGGGAGSTQAGGNASGATAGTGGSDGGGTGGIGSVNTSAAGLGVNGSYWISTTLVTAGSGGGGSGGYRGAALGSAGSPGSYGGGGASGAASAPGTQGIIVFTYVPIPPTNRKHRLSNNGTLLTSTQFNEVYVPTSNVLTFSGTSGYISYANSSAFGIGTNNFTIELWFNTNNPNKFFQMLFDTRQNGQSNQTKINLTIRNGASLDVAIGGTYIITGGTNSAVGNTWNHLAVTRQGNNIKQFLNGKQIGSTYSTATNFISPAEVVIGEVADSRGTYDGYFSGSMYNIRFVNGTALYTDNFSPPTMPLTNISNTVLLLDSTNNALTDSSNNNFTANITNTITTSNVSFIPFSTPSQNSSFTSNNIVSSQFNEVIFNRMSNVKMSILNTGNILINGQFDEVSGVS